MKSHGGDFEREGFVYTAREGGLEADLVEVDLHWGYYQDGSFVERLWEDVVRPARVSGYRRIWLVGISLGGSGALGFLREHPETLAGVVLLSPYLGPKELAEPIRDAGGLRRWKPAVTQPPKTFERFVEDNWGTLHRLTASKQAGPVLYLGYSNSEPMAPTLHLLAEALPPARVLRVTGGHRWTTWKRLWLEILQRQPFEEARGKAGPRRKPSR
jgi:pimeloyl-ACP methyl ester carboxylesterase